VIEHQVGEADQDLLAFGGRLAGPAAVVEGGAGAGHRRVDIQPIAARHLTQQAAVDRREAIKMRSRAGGDALAVDESAAVDP